MSSEAKYWTADEVLAGVKEKPAKERGTFPRFTLLCDGERFHLKTKKALDSLLQSTRATAPKVFVNAGYGVTIDFDNVTP